MISTTFSRPVKGASDPVAVQRYLMAAYTANNLPFALSTVQESSAGVIPSLDEVIGGFVFQALEVSKA